MILDQRKKAECQMSGTLRLCSALCIYMNDELNLILRL